MNEIQFPETELYRVHILLGHPMPSNKFLALHRTPAPSTTYDDNEKIHCFVWVLNRETLVTSNLNMSSTFSLSVLIYKFIVNGSG